MGDLGRTLATGPASAAVPGPAAAGAPTAVPDGFAAVLQALVAAGAPAQPGVTTDPEAAADDTAAPAGADEPGEPGDLPVLPVVTLPLLALPFAPLPAALPAVPPAALSVAPGGPPAGSPVDPAPEGPTSAEPAPAPGATSDTPPAPPPAPAPATTQLAATHLAAPPSTAPATAPTPAAEQPALARSVAAQVVPEVTRLATLGDGTRRITLELSPRSLGDVRVVLSVRNDAVHVRLVGDDRTSAVLGHAADDLVRALERAGFDQQRVVLAPTDDPTTAPTTHPANRPTDDPTGHGHRGGPHDTRHQHDPHEHHPGKGAAPRATDGLPVSSTAGAPAVLDRTSRGAGAPVLLDVRM